jgi:excisionase family DNA binding protein
METARVLKIIIEIDGNIVYEGKSSIEGLATTLPNKAWNEVLEKSISKDKLYSEVSQGKIPHFKIGSKILFNRSTLETWIKESVEKGRN